MSKISKEHNDNFRKQMIFIYDVQTYLIMFFSIVLAIFCGLKVFGSEEDGGDFLPGFVVALFFLFVCIAIKILSFVISKIENDDS